MTFEVGARQSFGEAVGNIVGGVDVFDVDVSTVNKLADFEIAALNVTRAHTGL